MTSHATALFAALALLCCPRTACSQKLTFIQLGVQQGLPATEVYNVFQDRKGYVWAFTEYGIVKHNGTRFIPVCTNLPFSESAVYRITESPAGEMYLANSRAHIYKVRADSAVRIPGFEAAGSVVLDLNESVFDLLVDRAENIYFTSYTKTWKLSQRTGKTELLHQRSDNEVRFKPVGNGYFMFRSLGTFSKIQNLVLFDEQGKKRLHTSLTAMSTDRNTIRKHNGRWYIMLAHGVLSVDADGAVKTVVLPKNTLNMEIAPNGNVWVGTAYAGLYELSPGLEIRDSYLCDRAVSDILFDNQSGMWVSTIGGGVFYCRNSQSVSYNHIPELAECISLLKVVDDRLFIGTEGGILFRCGEGGMRKIDLETGGSCINDVVAWNGHYYVGTKGGMYRSAPDFSGTTLFGSEYGGYSFAHGPDQSLLVVSASRVIRKKNGKEKCLALARKPRSIVTRLGDVFIGTREGVFLLGQKLSCPAYLDPLRGKNIAKLRLDANGNTWICTKGNGLYRLSPGNRLVHFAEVPSRVITDICFVGGNVAALATNNGVFAASYRNGRFSSWHLLLEEETVALEKYRGQLYIGTKSGLVMRDIAFLLRAPTYPFYLKNIVANGELYAPRKLRLPHDRNNLYFNFDLLAYQISYKQLFYRLEGPSPGKGNLYGTQLHLQNLQPGAYKLHVYPLNRLTNSRQKSIAVAFYIAPAFWQTRLFIGCMAFLCVVLIVGITWTIFYRTRKREEGRSRIMRLLAGYRLTALKAQINPHFISNSLAAIQQLILTNQTDRANHYIAKFSLLIRYLLDYSDKAVASLRDEIKIITLNIELEQLRFSNRFEFRTVIGDEVATAELFIPPLITQPFIENAIWHGLLPLTGERKPVLTLKITIENGRLVISIIDNGVGRKRINGSLPPHENERESKGTGLIMNRIENLNRLHAVNGAEIGLTDLEDENGNPAGTQVDIVFSLQMLNTLYDEQDQKHYY